MLHLKLEYTYSCFVNKVISRIQNTKSDGTSNDIIWRNSQRLEDSYQWYLWTIEIYSFPSFDEFKLVYREGCRMLYKYIKIIVRNINPYGYEIVHACSKTALKI